MSPSVDSRGQGQGATMTGRLMGWLETDGSARCGPAVTLDVSEGETSENVSKTNDNRLWQFCVLSCASPELLCCQTGWCVSRRCHVEFNSRIISLGLHRSGDFVCKLTSEPRPVNNSDMGL